MKRHLIFLLALLLAPFAQFVHAQSYSWTGEVTITTVYPNGNFSGLPSGTIIRIDTAHNPEQREYGAYFFLDRSMGDAYKDLLAVFLAAHTANRKVNILVQGCGTVTWAGPLIRAVQMPDREASHRRHRVRRTGTKSHSLFRCRSDLVPYRQAPTHWTARV